jgi:hypothetical protein
VQDGAIFICSINYINQMLICEYLIFNLKDPDDDTVIDELLMPAGDMPMPLVEGTPTAGEKKGTGCSARQLG